MKILATVSALVGILGALPAGPAVAQSFKGKTITVYIPVGPGGGYDGYGRMLANNIGRYLNGKPTVIATNMPGGGGRKLGNYLYNAAPKEGSAIAIIHHTTVYDSAFGSKGVQFNSSKFNWIGSMAGFTSIGFAWHTAGINSIEDAQKKQVAMGSTGKGATSWQYCALLNNMFGTKFKLITGYKGAKGIYLAVEQREVDGACGLSWTVTKGRQAHWIKDNKIKVFVQFALQKHPELPNVPTIMEYARSAEEKKMLQFVYSGLKFARPFLAPPGMSKARVAALRKAFMAVSKDARFHEAAKRRRFPLDPIDGETVQRLVNDIYNAPKPLKAMAKAALTGK
jgi:tripartite-type tricarboxylate transporter receptor subunit TctC